MKKKILFFGGSGFLGTYFCKNLLENNKVTIFDIKKPNFTHKNLKFIVGDILNESSVEKAIKKYDIVFHFAGWSDLETSIKNRDRTMELNILGTMNILKYCAQNKIKKFVYASTLYVFSRFGGSYKTSKQICELLINDYFKNTNVNYNILRFGSLYGPSAPKGNAIHDLVNMAIKKKEITYWGSGEETRQYIHARDAAKICENILSNAKLPTYLTLSGQESIRVKDLLIVINEIFKNKLKIKYNINKLKSSSHYKNTPFNFDKTDIFTPNTGQKILFDSYTELAEGIYEVIKYESKKSTKI
jgi:UDP-glucose 4-epimerase